MKTREKKLVIFLIIMVLVAVIYNVLQMNSKKTDLGKRINDIEKTKAYIDALDLNVDRIKVTGLDRYLMKKAEKEWGHDPFLLKVLYDALGEDNFIIEVTKSSEFVYSGYVQIKRKRMAVIDGLEYGVGDELKQGGIIVREIQRSNVVLEVSELHEAGMSNDGEGGAKMTIKRLIVPIAE